MTPIQTTNYQAHRSTTAWRSGSGAAAQARQQTAPPGQTAGWAGFGADLAQMGLRSQLTKVNAELLTVGRYHDNLAVQAIVRPGSMDTLNQLTAARTKLDSLRVGRGQLEAAADVFGTIGRIADVVEVSGEVASTWANSQATTTLGRAADATWAGLTTAGVSAVPVLNALDLVTGGAVQDLYNAGGHAVAALGRTAVGDWSAAIDYTEASRRGDYGVLSQAITGGVDYWSTNGLAGGLDRAWQGFTDLF